MKWIKFLYLKSRHPHIYASFWTIYILIEWAYDIFFWKSSSYLTRYNQKILKKNIVFQEISFWTFIFYPLVKIVGRVSIFNNLTEKNYSFSFNFVREINKMTLYSVDLTKHFLLRFFGFKVVLVESMYICHL